MAVQELQRQIQIVRNEPLIGRTFEVLVDVHNAARGHWAGRTTSATADDNSLRRFKIFWDNICK